MILQKNLFFGIYSFELRVRMFNGLESAMSEVRASLKELLMSEYEEKDGERYTIAGQESMTEERLKKLRRDFFVSSRYEELYNFEDDSDITTDERTIHYFYSKNGVRIRITRMSDNRDHESLIYLYVECNTMTEREIIERALEKQFSYLSYSEVLDIVKDKILTDQVFLFMLSIEANSHKSLKDDVINLYNTVLNSENSSLIESAIYCIGFDESDQFIYAKYFQEKITLMKEANTDASLFEAYDYVIEEIERRLSLS